MITTIAQTLTLFCTLVVVLSGTTWILTLKHHTPRQVAHRIAVTFGVFAVASGYVWLDLGPDIDARLARYAQPLLAQPDPGPVDV